MSAVCPVYPAALQYSVKPFLSLIGDPIPNFFPKRVLSLMVFLRRVANHLHLPMFNTGPANFYGGIFLHTHLNNAARVQHLKSAHHYTDSQICLLSNPNSRYAQDETGSQHWPNNRGAIFHASTVAQIDTAFNQFKTNGALAAMIVTADGFFQDNKDAIVNNANRSGKYVTYPFKIYAQGNVKPANQRHTLHGPDLASEYRALGQKAAEVINSGRPSSFTRAKSYNDISAG
jgi:hypothetical protein